VDRDRPGGVPPVVSRTVSVNTTCPAVLLPRTTRKRFRPVRTRCPSECRIVRAENTNKYMDDLEIRRMDTNNISETTETSSLNMEPANDGVDGALALQMTREQRRSRRKRDVRARTISVKRMTKRELEIGRLLYPETDYWKPRTRAECAEGPRPCPFVSCKYHLFIDVSSKTGAIKLNFPDLEVWEMNESCALDVADRGGTTLEDVGAIMNLTRERIRQLEVKALAKLNAVDDMLDLRDYIDEGPKGKRRLPVLTADDFEDSGKPEESDDDEDSEDALDHADTVSLDDFCA